MIEAIDGAYLDTNGVLAVAAGFADDVCHEIPVVLSVKRKNQPLPHSLNTLVPLILVTDNNRRERMRLEPHSFFEVAVGCSE
jgi:hypothetical protein